MKTPRFWYPQDGAFLQVLESELLAPFSFLFKAGTRLRRALASEPYRANIPVVCVGNVVAGGAGKTPTSLALAKILKQRGQKPVFVTRGYGGKGVLTCVDPARHSASDVGDEALLLAKEAPTWAAQDRVAAMREAEKDGTVLILDDGLQNPHFAPTASFLVIDGDVGIGNGRLIPAGPLRESLNDVSKRITAAIIIGDSDRQNLASRFQMPVFRARLIPNLPSDFPSSGRFAAFAGIARPEKFYATAKSLGLNLVMKRDFPDHHAYSEADIAALRAQALSLDAPLLTTEKDAIRLPPDFRAEVLTLPVRLVFEDPRAEAAIAAFALEK